VSGRSRPELGVGLVDRCQRGLEVNLCFAHSRADIALDVEVEVVRRSAPGRRVPMDVSDGCVGTVCAALARPVVPRRREGAMRMALYGAYLCRLRHLFARGEMRRPKRSHRLVCFRPVVAGSLRMRTEALLAIVLVFRAISRDRPITHSIRERRRYDRPLAGWNGRGLPLPGDEAQHSSAADARPRCTTF